MTSYENLNTAQKVQATIHRDVKSMCTETCHLMGLDITKAATEIIAELVYKKLSVYGTDLEAFAKHAKRQTIQTEDVKLLIRRNPSLLTHISSLPITNNIKEKRRKTLPHSKPETTLAPIGPPKEQEENMSVVLQPSERKDLEEAKNMSVEDMIDLTFD